MKTKLVALLVGKGSRVPYVLESAKNIPNLEIVLVLSCIGEDIGTKTARKYGIDARIIEWAYYRNNPKAREIFSQNVLCMLEDWNVDFVVMAGWRVLMPKSFIEEYVGRAINVHPSLLPDYRGDGDKAIEQQWQNRYRDLKAGCTLHYVDEGMDTGKPILQYALDSTKFNSKKELARAIHEKEERLLCEALELIGEEKI